MDGEKKLNTDIAGAISSFQSAIKSFELQKKLYKLILRGKGLEFDGYRAYSSDDDAGTIDWRASKRANSLLVKKYIEEKNLKVVFAIDVGENMVFGSAEKLKCEYGAEVIASLSNLILESGNKIGYFFFNEKVNEFVRPGRGKNHFWRFIDALTNASLYKGNSDLGNALDFAIDYLDRSIVSIIIVSDFIRVDKGVEDRLALVAQKFETMAIMIKDPLDKTLPDISGELVVEDPVTKERLLINPRLARAGYEKHSAEQEHLVKEMFRKRDIDLLELMTDKPFVVSLATFLKERTRVVRKRVSL